MKSSRAASAIVATQLGRPRDDMIWSIDSYHDQVEAESFCRTLGRPRVGASPHVRIAVGFYAVAFITDVPTRRLVR